MDIDKDTAGIFELFRRPGAESVLVIREAPKEFARGSLGPKGQESVQLFSGPCRLGDHLPPSEHP